MQKFSPSPLWGIFKFRSATISAHTQLEKLFSYQNLQLFTPIQTFTFQPFQLLKISAFSANFCSLRVTLFLLLLRQCSTMHYSVMHFRQVFSSTAVELFHNVRATSGILGSGWKLLCHWEKSGKNLKKTEKLLLILLLPVMFWMRGQIDDGINFFFISVAWKMRPLEWQTKLVPCFISRIEKFRLKINTVAYGGVAGVLVALGLLPKV